MANIIELFKDKVPTRKKVYHSLFCGDLESKNISYARFKKGNYELKVLSVYFQCMDNTNLLDEKTIKNIFNYFSTNLHYNHFSSAKKTILLLNEMKSSLNNRLLEMDLEENYELCTTLANINHYINMLKVIISNKYDYSIDEFEKMMEFEKLSKKILKPEEYNETEALKLIMDNIKLLNYHDHRERSFSDLLCSYIGYANEKNNSEQLEYYKKIAKYIVNVRNLSINKRKLSTALRMGSIDVCASNALNEKINNFHYNNNTARYHFNDYTLSIDNVGTNKIDDALSIERTGNNTYILGIHITDIYSLGDFKDNLDDEEIVIENINKVSGSLKQKKTRNAISLFVEVSNMGVVLNYKIIPTILIVDKNLTYSDVSKIAYENKNSTILERTLSDLISLYSVVENRLMPTIPSLSNIAAVLVEKFMLLNGCIYSEYFEENCIPGIFVSGNKSNNQYSIDKCNYESGFDIYSSYSKSTSPIYDKSSLLCQYILHKCAFRNVPDSYKNILRYRLKPIVDDLNKKSS